MASILRTPSELRGATTVGIADNLESNAHTSHTRSGEDETMERRRHQSRESVIPHRGSGGLVRGRAVFCLPPDASWFQGHFAYAARGGCMASVGLLANEIPVDPCMRCCHGGFSRYNLVFIHHESGRESTIVVERYGGNMMNLHAEAAEEGDGGAQTEDSSERADSDLAFHTDVMKSERDALPLLGKYFQSIVRAAREPSELRDCIVCIGPMDVPRSLLQGELAAPVHAGSAQSLGCSVFGPCRDASQALHARKAKTTPALSPCPSRSVASPELSPSPNTVARPVSSGSLDSMSEVVGGAGYTMRPRRKMHDVEEER